MNSNVFLLFNKEILRFFETGDFKILSELYILMKFLFFKKKNRPNFNFWRIYMKISSYETEPHCGTTYISYHNKNYGKPSSWWTIKKYYLDLCILWKKFILFCFYETLKNNCKYLFVVKYILGTRTGQISFQKVNLCEWHY